MDIKKALLVFAPLVLIVGVIGVTVLLLSQPQDTRSSAQVPNLPAPTAVPACQTPAQVTNVRMSYPNCPENSQECIFTEASCTWDAVTGATSYTVKATQVESGAVAKNETISAPTTKIVFPVTAGKTYQCDVSAVNACGAGAPGSDSLLCQVEAGPSPSPSPVPVVTTAPTPVPTVNYYTCGQPGCSATSPCINGLECVQTSGGQSYCTYPIYKTACQGSPSTTSCCSAPAQPRPTLPPTGSTSTSIMLGAGLVLMMIIGGAFILL